MPSSKAETTDPADGIMRLAGGMLMLDPASILTKSDGDKGRSRTPDSANGPLASSSMASVASSESLSELNESEELEESESSRSGISLRLYWLSHFM